MNMEIDRIPLTQLPSRYGIARSALYTRLKDLQIQSFREGKKAYVDASQLYLLDELHVYLQKGGTTREFIKQREARQINHSELIQDSPGQAMPMQVEMFATAIAAIASQLVPARESCLTFLRELEEAYEGEWLLSTSEVASLLGLSCRTITNYGQQFEHAGFTFTRSSRRGREVGWLVGHPRDRDRP